MTLANTSSGNVRLVVGLAITIATLTLFVFAPVRHNDFLNWDDQNYVTQNDHVRGGLTRAGITWAFTSSHSANWHPLTWISHMVDVEFFGMKPAGHHITNLLFHAANSALLFLLLRALTGSIWRSALVAVIFALHPLRVESVAWLAERKDVLSTFFGFLCLIAYGSYVKSKVEDRRSKLAYALAFTFLALGLMSKPMLVTWPFVMLLLDFWPLRRINPTAPDFRLSSLKPLILEKLPFFALMIASCVATVIAQQRGGAVASLEHLPVELRLQNAVVAYVEYLYKFFWPTNLLPIYPHPTQIGAGRIVLALALLTALTALAWAKRRQWPFALTGWLWFLGTLVPVIGIVQVGSQAFADRYTYIPMIGVALASVWLSEALLTKLRFPKPIRICVSLLVLGMLGWKTIMQIAYWRNTETLFRYTLKSSPDNAQALYGLGSYLVDHGQTQEGKQLLEQTIHLQPTFVEAIGTLAGTFDSEGRYAQAVQLYQDALRVQPDDWGVLNNYAWLLASCPEAVLRDGHQAVQFATRACELTGYNKPLFIGTLAAAQAETGDFQTAIATAERAATLASSLG